MEFDESYFKGETIDGFYVEEQMKHAWAAQIEVLEEIRRICQKHGFKFFADWGSLLGAVRHHGFIPWDDDLDIGMLRGDYMDFLKIAGAELPTGFEIKSLYNDPGHDNVKARVISGRHMNFDKEYLEKFHLCPFAIGIDIFPLDYIPRSKEKSDRQNEWIRLAMTAAASISPNPPYSKDEIALVRQIEEKTGYSVNYNNNLFHELKKIVDELSAMYGPTESDHVCSMIDFSMGWPREYRVKIESYSQAVEMPFENTTIPVPIGYDEILTIKYGENYMTPVQCSSSHDYPFYKEQELCLKDELEKEFKTTIAYEMVRQLIDMKIAQSVAGD